MKRFLSVLLAVMMVLSSTVSYAAPSLADFVDSVIEAPEFEDELFEETPVEDDSATLSEETTNEVAAVKSYEFNTDGVLEVSPSGSRGETYYQETVDGEGYLVLDLSSTATEPTTKNLNNINTSTKFECDIRKGGFKSFSARYRVEAPDGYDDALSSITSTIHARGAGYTANQMAKPAVERDEAGWYNISVTGARDYPISSIQISFDGLVTALGGTVEDGTYTTTDDFRATKIYIDYVRFEQYTPEVTIVNDVEGIIDDFSETIQGGTYTIDELKTMLDPNDVMDSNGYFLAGVKDAGVTFYEDEVTFTENSEYTAVWDMIKTLNGNEFASSTDRLTFTGSKNSNTPNSSNEAATGTADSEMMSDSYADYLQLTVTDTGSTSGAHNLKAHINGLNIPEGEITDIVFRLRFNDLALGATSDGKLRGTICYGPYGGTSNTSGGSGGWAVSGNANEWVEVSCATSSSNLMTKIIENGLYGIRFDFGYVLPVGAVIDIDYIRFIGADAYYADNVLIDMSAAPVDIPNFKIFLDEVETVQDVLDVADNALFDAGYTGYKMAKAVRLNGVELDPSLNLSEQKVVDHSSLEILFARKKVLLAYEFDSSKGTCSVTGGSGVLGTEDDFSVYTATIGTAADTPQHRVNVGSKLAIPKDQIDKFVFRVKSSGATFKPQYFITDDADITNDGTNHVKSYTTPFPSSWSVIQLSADEYLSNEIVNNENANVDTFYIQGPQVSNLEIHFDYIRVYGKEFVSSYTLDINGEIVEVDGTGVTTVEGLLAHEAVTAHGTALAVRVKGTNNIFTTGAINELDTYQILYTEGDNFGFDFDDGIGGTVGSHNASYTAVTGPFTEDGVTYKRFSNITSTANRFRMMLTGLNVPANKLSDVYITMRSSLETPYGYPIYCGVVGASGIDDSTNGCLGSAKVIDTNPEDDWYTLHYDIPTTSVAYTGGVGVIRYDFKNDLTAAGDYVDIDDIRFVSVDNMTKIAVIEGYVGNEFVSKTVPFNSTTTVAAASRKMGLDSKDGYVSSLSYNGTEAKGSTKLASLVNNEDVQFPVLSFEYTERYPVFLKVTDGETTTTTTYYIDGSEEASYLLDKVTDSSSGKVAGALRVEVEDTSIILSADDSLRDVAEGVTLKVIWSNETMTAFEFNSQAEVDATTIVASNGKDKLTKEFNAADGAICIKSGDDETSNVQVNFPINFPKNTLKRIEARLKIVDESRYATAATYTSSSHYWAPDAVSFTVTIPGVKSGEWIEIDEDAFGAFSDMQISDVTKFRWDFYGSKGYTLETGDYFEIDYIRFVSKLPAPVAVIEGNFNGEQVSVNVPYDSTTTVAEVIDGIVEENSITYSTVEGTAFIGGATGDTTITSLLDDDSGYLELSYVANTQIAIDKNIPETSDVTEDNVTVPTDDDLWYAPLQTVADVLANISLTDYESGVWAIAGLSTSANGALLNSTDTIESLGDNTTLYIVWKEVKRNVTVDKNIPADSDLTDSQVIVPEAKHYDISATVADILADVTCLGTWEPVGLSYTADGPAILETTTVEKLTGLNLYVVWKELNILNSYEFNTDGVTDGVGKGQFRSSTVTQAFLADDDTNDGEGVLKIDLSTSTHTSDIHSSNTIKYSATVADLETIKMRFKVVDPSGTIDVSKNAVWAHTSRTGVAGTIDANKISNTVADENGWHYAEWSGSVFTKGEFDSFQIGFNNGTTGVVFKNNAGDDSTIIYIDYIRFIGKDPLNYVTVDVSALTNEENDVKVYSFNKYATFAQVLAKLDADIELDENTAITGLIYNGTTYTGSTTLYSVVGQTDCVMTVDYDKAKAVTLVQESLTSPDNKTVVSNIADSAYPASTTLGTLKALLALDSKDYFVEGFITADKQYGNAYSDDTKLSDIADKDATEVKLSVVYDKDVILYSNDFTAISNENDYKKIVADDAAEDGSALQLTAKAVNEDGTSTYYNVSLPSIDTSEIADVETSVKASVANEAQFAFVFSLNGRDKTYGGGGAYTYKTDYDVVRLSKYTTGLDEGVITSVRPTQAHSSNGFVEGNTVTIDYVRVLGKPLPEVNVADIDVTYGTLGLSGWDLANVDYTSTMTFADLVEKLNYKPSEPKYRIVAFTSGENRYELNQNIAETLGTTETVELTPVVEAVYAKNYTVNFGTQADIIKSEICLEVTDHSSTLADLAALVVDQGNMLFKGFATEEDYRDNGNDATVLDLATTYIYPSTEEEYENNGKLTPVQTYYAIWEDYSDRINKLYSLEFTNDEGYGSVSPGHGSRYVKGALNADGKTYLYGDSDNKLPEDWKSEFVTHDNDNGTICLNYEGSPYSVAAAEKAGKPLAIYDSHIVFDSLKDVGDDYIPAGTLDKIIIRMKYELPENLDDNIIDYVSYLNTTQSDRTLDVNQFYAPWFFYHLRGHEATAAEFSNSKDSRISVANGSAYRNNWFTIVLDANEYLGLDDYDLDKLRFDPTDTMPAGSKVYFDFVRFVAKDPNKKIEKDAVKSQKDFAETDPLYSKLATTIRAQVDNSDRNGVRVMGWLYVYAGTSAHTQNAGWMFSASDRFKKAASTLEDYDEENWMQSLTMDLQRDEDFNTSDLILVGNYINNGSYATTAHDYDSEENHLFSAVLYNIPVKNYKSNFVVRPYVEYAGKFIYGKPFEMNFYDFAFGKDYDYEINADLSNVSSGAYKNCVVKDPDHDCAICNYLEDRYVAWRAYVAEKATFTEHYDDYFKNMLASPDKLIGNIVVPTGTIIENSAETVKLEVHNSVTGKFETITVNKANTWPALVRETEDGDETKFILAPQYALRPCAISATGTEGVYYIMSLGYVKDSDNGNYVGIEKSDTSVLNGTDAEVNGNEMFIRNRFVPEAQSPFRKINRLAQLPMSGTNINDATFVDSFFLGDHGFGDYWFSTTIWSGITREYWAGKTAYPVDYSKLVVKYNYKDKEGNITSSEWVTYDKTAIELMTTIDFSNISYIVSNDLDNKPGKEPEVHYPEYDEVVYDVECPFEVENLVFLFGEVDVPAASESSMEFDTNFTANHSTDMNNFVYTGDRYNTSNFQRIHENYTAHPGIIQLREYKTNADVTASGYIETGTTKMQLDAPLYNNVRIRILYADVDMGARSASGYSATLSYTRSDGVSGSKSFEFDDAGVDADGFMILDFDMSEVFDWRGTITDIRLTLPMLSTGAGYWYIDYIRFLATGYDSNAELELIGGIFEGFEKGFKINGFESSSDDAFKPTVDFFETTEEAKNGYASFNPEADVDGDGDKNYADWTIDPLYTFDYYGIYNDIIKNFDDEIDDDGNVIYSRDVVKDNESTEVNEKNATWNFASLYDSKYKDTRWNTMTDSKYATEFTNYFKSYELKNVKVNEDGIILSDEDIANGETPYAAISDEFHSYDVNDTTYSKPSKQLIYKPNFSDGVVKGDVLTMTLNSSALYKGKPHYMWSSYRTSEIGTDGVTPNAWHFWPHLLIQQSTGSQPVKVTKDKETGKLITDAKYSAAADRIFAEFDIRLAEFVDLDNTDGEFNMSFLLYAYLCPNVNPGAKIWFGIPLADDSDVTSGGMTWGRESGANTHMCKLSQAMVYGSEENSITYAIKHNEDHDKDGITSTNWIHVKLDLTPYIDMAIEMANAEDAFGLGVTTREDWHFNGVNIGYECKGNVDATFELANFNFYSYNDPANN